MSRTERARPQRAERWSGQPNSPDGEAGPGALLHEDGVRFRVHATRARRVDVVLDDRTIPLERIDASTFGVFVPDLRAGARYRYSLDGGEPLPDPWSRWQPDGPHAASCVLDPSFAWSDAEWRGVSDEKQFIYEMHIGTFTPERTWAAATHHLEHLAGLGITAIELMPVAEFPGDFGWGYDGVQLFAPYHGYGAPNDMRAFIDRAHALGMAVLLDVVEVVLEPGETRVFDYTCTFTEQPDYEGTNTATVTWLDVNDEPQSVSTTQDVSFELAGETNVEVEVYDDKVTLGSPGELLGVANWHDGTTEFTYSLTLPGVAGECVDHTNTAVIPATGDEADQTVTVCVELGPEVEKTANAAFDREYFWDLTKDVDVTQVEIIGTDLPADARFREVVTRHLSALFEKGAARAAAAVA